MLYVGGSGLGDSTPALKESLCSRNNALDIGGPREQNTQGPQSWSLCSHLFLGFIIYVNYCYNSCSLGSDLTVQPWSKEKADTRREMLG